MQKTTDFKSDLDEGQIGMIGEFLKQEDTKQMTKQLPKPVAQKEPSLFIQLQDMKDRSIITNQSVTNQ